MPVHLFVFRDVGCCSELCSLLSLLAFSGLRSGAENYKWTRAATQYNWDRSRAVRWIDPCSVHKGVQSVTFLHGSEANPRTLTRLPKFSTFRCPTFDPTTRFEWMNAEQKACCVLWLKYARAVEQHLTSLPEGHSCSPKGVKMLDGARKVIAELARPGGFP